MAGISLFLTANDLIAKSPDEAFALTGTLLAAGTACTLPFVVKRLGIDYKELPDEARDELEALYGAEPQGFARRMVYGVRSGLWAAKYKRSLGADVKACLRWTQGEWDVELNRMPCTDGMDGKPISYLERVDVETPKWDAEKQRLVI